MAVWAEEHQVSEIKMSDNLVKCCFDGCRATSKQPTIDGWANLGDWGHGVKDGPNNTCRSKLEYLRASWHLVSLNFISARLWS